MAAELERNPLWLILVEAVHALPMYPSHRAYVRDSLLLEQPEITVEELSQRLDIPLGEAMVILQEIGHERETTTTDGEQNDT
ncbi:MAG: hypothetical protein NWF12_03635 [Candidatus Bathyarchaeota archaeon]|nr:hypothetical protein [Candidatus Bathyarchaeota archaeon]